MSTPEVRYRIVSRIFTTQWSDQLQQAVKGVLYQIANPATGNVLPVFVPEMHDTPDNVDQAAMMAIEHDNAIMQLGG